MFLCPWPYIIAGLQPIQINPKEDTVLIQYNSLNHHKSGKRTERDALKELSFDARIELLPFDCKEVVKDLIKDILQAPLRKRNSLLGMLRMEDNIESSREREESRPNQASNRRPTPKSQTRPTIQEKPRSSSVQDNSKPLDVISQTFSNFPAFQKTSEGPDTIR